MNPTTIQKATAVQDAITDCVNNMKYLGKCVDELVDGAVSEEETGDIKQAAKWLQEGKRVARKAWGNSDRCPRLYANLCDVKAYWDGGDRGSAAFTLFDLLADDWVVVK